MKILVLLVATLTLAVGTQAQKRRLNAAPTPAALEQGATADGKRVGKWKFYNRREELELVFDYDSSRIGFQQPDTTRFLVRVGEQWLPKPLARPPHVLGSTDQRLNDLLGRLRYPVSALQQQLQGAVLLSYTVDVNGHTRDYVVEKSLSPACDQEVWRALKELPDLWIPAVYLGRPTPARFYLTVRFRMMDEAEYGRLAREEKQRAQRAPGDAPAPSGSGPQPHYTHEVVVTAVAIERGMGTEQLGR